MRRLSELEVAEREEELGRAMRARAAARDAAEGERRRRLSIEVLEEAEERRLRKERQRMANEAMERERERQVRVKVLLNEMEDVLASPTPARARSGGSRRSEGPRPSGGGG